MIPGKYMGGDTKEVGPIPPVRDACRKEAGRHSFKFFCEQYFRSTFHVDWGVQRLSLLDSVQHASDEHRLIINKADRAMGMTSISIAASLWIALYGKSSFTLAISSNSWFAQSFGESVGIELQTNELLLEDFPNAVYPIWKLEGFHQRSRHQTCGGQPTLIEMTQAAIRLPVIAGCESSGCAIGFVGAASGFAGLARRAGPDNKKIRPEFLIIDDPFTDEAARSPSMARSICERVFSRAIRLGVDQTKKLPGVIFLGPTAQEAISLCE